ncbi:hypothetical protein Tco_1554183 [Tanacetum coccineum]
MVQRMVLGLRNGHGTHADKTAKHEAEEDMEALVKGTSLGGFHRNFDQWDPIIFKPFNLSVPMSTGSSNKMKFVVQIKSIQRTAKWLVCMTRFKIRFMKGPNNPRVQLPPFAKTYNPFPRRDLKHDLVPDLEFHWFTLQVSITLLSVTSSLHPLLDLNDFLSGSWISSGPGICASQLQSTNRDLGCTKCNPDGLGCFSLDLSKGLTFVNNKCYVGFHVGATNTTSSCLEPQTLLRSVAVCDESSLPSGIARIGCMHIFSLQHAEKAASCYIAPFNLISSGELYLRNSKNSHFGSTLALQLLVPSEFQYYLQMAFRALACSSE